MIKIAIETLEVLRNRFLLFDFTQLIWEIIIYITIRNCFHILQPKPFLNAVRISWLYVINLKQNIDSTFEWDNSNSFHESDVSIDFDMLFHTNLRGACRPMRESFNDNVRHTPHHQKFIWSHNIGSFVFLFGLLYIYSEMERFCICKTPVYSTRCLATKPIPSYIVFDCLM